MHTTTFAQRLTAEFVGTALRLAAVVGPGIMGDGAGAGTMLFRWLVPSLPQVADGWCSPATA
jgi:hypothetical protein